MDVLSNDMLKGILIADLKAASSVTDKLDEYSSSSVEIRESNWQSDQFLYPNIRIRVIRNTPEDGDCEKYNVTVSWMTFTEDQSSATCDEFSGIIATYYKGKQFSVSFQGSVYHVSLVTVTLLPAIRSGVNVWRSEVVLEGYVSLQS